MGSALKCSAALGLLALLLGACRGTGNYPVDFLSEMHYQQSYRSQEPQRLSPPALAVPVTGREAPLTLASVASLRNPVPTTTQNLAQGEALYRTNCRMCHGEQGKGDGPLKGSFEQAQLPAPADLTSATVRARRDGEVYALITNGVRRPELTSRKDYLGMPGWQKLLTERERWLLVLHLRKLQGQ